MSPMITSNTSTHESVIQTQCGQVIYIYRRFMLNIVPAVLTWEHGPEG